ncbi:hypothetical protein KJ763_00785 [Patescibacteria group bacterium]|nr:hypothetical protein [Patescibacteria group bacterium]
MKINLGVYTKGDIYFWKILNDELGKNLKKILSLFTDGIAEALSPLEIKIKSFLEEEKLNGEIAFRCWLKLKSEEVVELHIQVCFQPINFDEWFILCELPNLYFPKTLILRTKILATEIICDNIIKNTFSPKIKFMVSYLIQFDLLKKLMADISNFKKWLSCYDSSLTSGFFITL